MTELTDKTISGWVKTTEELEDLKTIIEAKTKSRLVKRSDDNADRLIKENKIHLSLAPIPINIHPFKLKDIVIYSCIYDQGLQVRIYLIF